MTTASHPLPPSLQPWRRWLSDFGPELAVELGRLLQCLHPLLGSFRGQDLGGEPWPDGLGDLRTRGPYERLLASEWLLADALPDEFTRRAAAGEHLFLSPHPRARQAQRLIVALFDSGPLQLGAPRLAQLALWILLARRAAEAGGELRWGVLQQPGALLPATTSQDLRRLLEQRRFEPAGPEHWVAWHAHLQQEATGLRECWLIGPPALQPGRAPAPSHQVHLARGLGGEALDVTVRGPHGERRLALPLPAAGPAQRLLRGRFSDTPPAGALHVESGERLSMQRAPIISLQGKHLAVPRLDGRGLTIYAVPRVADRKPAQPRDQRWAKGAEPLAVTLPGKQAGALFSDASHLFFWQVPGLDVRPRPPVEDFDAPPGTGSWLPSAWLRHGRQQRFCVVDRSRRLVAWSAEECPPDGRRFAAAGAGMEVVDREVLACVQLNDHQLAYVVEAAGRLWLRRLQVRGPNIKASLPLCPAPSAAPAVLFAQPSPKADSACAVRTATGTQESWRIHRPSLNPARRAAGEPFDALDVKLAPHWRAIGLVWMAGEDRYALLLQSPDRTAIHLQQPDGSELLYTAPAPLKQCSVCPHTGLIAMLTEKHQLIAYSAPQRTLLLFVSPGAKDVHDAG
ncbi:hypothetical protein [Eleftheria terrae]|uniref:hypothetical protein n=1 Tax=Eleftheria terrae TaxID=1597781 RepID=UPI00263A698B|nr:hypothetical protein [Eleftheria terrae]WKB53371.1 hypothetical protein N7L95_02945 [Eleftheria terrae]